MGSRSEFRLLFEGYFAGTEERSNRSSDHLRRAEHPELGLEAALRRSPFARRHNRGP